MNNLSAKFIVAFTGLPTYSCLCNIFVSGLESIETVEVAQGVSFDFSKKIIVNGESGQLVKVLLKKTDVNACNDFDEKNQNFKVLNSETTSLINSLLDDKELNLEDEIYNAKKYLSYERRLQIYG